MAGDEIRNECAPVDRGAFGQLTFTRAARGFTLHVSDYGRQGGALFAFDRIEDVAAWLVEQYGPPPKAPVAKAARKPARRRR